MTWSDAKKTLTIGARSGTFPGMLQSRTFRVVFVTSNHGAGSADTPSVDQTVSYSGASIDVVAP
jgi:alpha-D-xyloside xylohydrolase